MRMITASMAVILCLSMPSVAQQKYHTTVEGTKNEKWWGVFVGAHEYQPFVKPFEADTSDSDRDGFLCSTLLSSAGRYIWSPDPMHVRFDGEKFEIDSPYQQVEVRKAGKTLREAYLLCCHKHFPPKDIVPAAELLTMPVYDMDRSSITHDQASVLAMARRIKQASLPAGIIMIPDGWQAIDGLSFESSLYPDARAMIEELHGMGFKIMLTVTPYVSASGRSYTNAREGLLKGKDSRPVVFETATGYYACRDLTVTGQRELVAGMLAELAGSYGVDGFRFDSSRAMEELADRQSMRAAFLEQWRSMGDNYRLVEYTTAPTSPLTTRVSNLTLPALSWQCIDDAVSGVIDAGLLGFTYCRPAFASDEVDVDSDLLMHWLQTAAFLPVVSISESIWSLDERKLACVRQALAFRSSLTDYIAGAIDESSRTAEPLVRHLEYQFPRSGFYNCNDEFMLGNKYLIVPVIDKSTKRMVRLPRGVWSAPDGKRIKGPAVLSVDVSDNRLLYYILNGK